MFVATNPIIDAMLAEWREECRVTEYFSKPSLFAYDSTKKSSNLRYKDMRRGRYKAKVDGSMAQARASGRIARRLHRIGWTLREISEVFGATPATIYQRIRTADWNAKKEEESGHKAKSWN